MTMWKPPRRVVIRLSDGTEIVTHELPRAQPDPSPDTDPPEIVPPGAAAS